MEIKEEWKDIQGYENLYQVSNFGRVKSLGNGKSGNSKERILKQGINKQNYFSVDLCKEGKKKTYRVNRLVAQAFLLNPNNYPCVNHIDENKQNNCVSNLEWCTYQYNNSYGTKIERSSKANQKPILQFNREGTKIIGKWESAVQASNELNINNGNITACCKGKYKVVGGYRWMYLQDYINRMNKLYSILKKAS
jgi:hypothetical protein